MDFEESFALLGERQWLWRENWALAARLHHAPSLKVAASLEDIDYHHPRGLKWVQIDQRRASQWVVNPRSQVSNKWLRSTFVPGLRAAGHSQVLNFPVSRAQNRPKIFSFSIKPQVANAKIEYVGEVCE